VVFQSGERAIGLLIDGLADIVEDAANMNQASGRRGLLGSAVIGQRFTDLLDLETVLSAGWDGWLNGSSKSAQQDLHQLAAVLEPKVRLNELTEEKG
jgi:hypothetical protein